MIIDLTFDDPAPAPVTHLNGNGRYTFPNRDGTPKPRGWQRSTNLAGAISDQKNLQNWTVRTTLAGLAMRPDLFAELRALIERVGTDKADLLAAQGAILDLAERAKDAAGGGWGRDRGNRIHDLCEIEWAGLPPAVLTEDETKLMRKVAEAMEEAELDPIPGLQERFVLIDQVGTCGKFDTLALDRRTGLVVVVDTKSQFKFWTWLEVEIQLAEYANAVAMWDEERGCWTNMPEVDRTRGAILHCPELEGGGHGPPTVIGLDLERGWRNAQLAHSNVKARSECGSTRQEVSGRPWSEVRPSGIEGYARRLSEVESTDEGERVWQEIVRAGLDGNPILREVAMDRAKFFSGQA